MPARKPRRRSGKPQEARSPTPPVGSYRPPVDLPPERLLEVVLADLRDYYRDEEGSRPREVAGWEAQLMSRAVSSVWSQDRILRRKYLTGLMVTALGWIVEEGADHV